MLFGLLLLAFATWNVRWKGEENVTKQRWVMWEDVDKKNQLCVEAILM